MSKRCVTCFLEVSLACLGSVAAAVQPNFLWNSQKTCCKTFSKTCRPKLYIGKVGGELSERNRSFWCSLQGERSSGLVALSLSLSLSWVCLKGKNGRRDAWPWGKIGNLHSPTRVCKVASTSHFAGNNTFIRILSIFSELQSGPGFPIVLPRSVPNIICVIEFKLIFLQAPPW